MTASIQSASRNTLPTRALANNGDSQAPPAAFQSELAEFQAEMESLSSGGKTPQVDKSVSPPQPKRAQDTDKTDLLATALVPTSGQKNEIIPPLTLALSTSSSEDIRTAKQLGPSQPQPKDAAPRISDLSTTQRKRARDTDKANLLATAPVHTSEKKNQVIPPLTLAMPASSEDVAAAKQVEPAEPQAKDAAPETLNLQVSVPDGKPTEAKPAALAFAANLTMPAFSNTAADKARLKPLPTQMQDPLTPKVSSPGDQAKLKSGQQSAFVPEPIHPEKPPAVLKTAAGAAQPEARAKTPELPPAPAAKTDFVLPRTESKTSEITVTSKVLDSPPAPSLAARMDRMIEPATAPPTSPNDIRVRVPDNSGGSTEVRFLEASGDVRVSVRTANADLAQTLRGGLDDLTHKLSNEGIRAEIWHPAVQASATQSDWSQHSPQQEQPGAGGHSDGGNGSGNQESRGQRDSQQRRPQWLEELEASTSDRNN